MYRVLGKSRDSGEIKPAGEYKSLGHAYQQVELLRKIWGDEWVIWVDNPQTS